MGIPTYESSPVTVPHIQDAKQAPPEAPLRSSVTDTPHYEGNRLRMILDLLDSLAPDRQNEHITDIYRRITDADTVHVTPLQRFDNNQAEPQNTPARFLLTTKEDRYLWMNMETGCSQAGELSSPACPKERRQDRRSAPYSKTSPRKKRLSKDDGPVMCCLSNK